MARPWKSNPEWLKRQIERMRAEGMSVKAIAYRVGYSCSRIQVLCRVNHIKKRFKHKPDIATETGIVQALAGGARPEES